MGEDPGVMGNLPRSRPGRRSEKRASGSSAGARQDGGSGSAKRTKPTGASASAPRGAAGPAAGGPGGPAASRGPDPIGDAFRVAGKLAGASLGIAASVLRRLPRP